MNIYILDHRSVSKVHDEWFADEDKVRKAVGLLERPVQFSDAKEVQCWDLVSSYFIFIVLLLLLVSKFFLFCFHCFDSWLVESVLKPILVVGCILQLVDTLSVLCVGQVCYTIEHFFGYYGSSSGILCTLMGYLCHSFVPFDYLRGCIRLDDEFEIRCKCIRVVNIL